MKRKKFDTVWFTLEATEAEAVVITLRSDLMTPLRSAVKTWGIFSLMDLLQRRLISERKFPTVISQSRCSLL
jgi:predicted XRE-type DNA-binding protein